MSTTASANKFTIVPPEIWAALRLKPGAPVHWEVRGGEAVMRPAPAGALNRGSVATVAGMLAPKLKGRRIDWRAAEQSALAGWGKLR